MKNYKYPFLFVISFLTAGVLWQIISFYLPKYPEIHHIKQNGNSFYNINLYKIFSSGKIITNFHQSNIKQISETLNNLELKAVYNDGKKAFIIIKNQGKTVFLDLNQTYKGYKLIKISNNYVIFKKNAEKYILSFNNKQSITQNLKIKKSFPKKSQKIDSQI